MVNKRKGKGVYVFIKDGNIKLSFIKWPDEVFTHYVLYGLCELLYSLGDYEAKLTNFLLGNIEIRNSKIKDKEHLIKTIFHWFEENVHFYKKAEKLKGSGKAKNPFSQEEIKKPKTINLPLMPSSSAVKRFGKTEQINKINNSLYKKNNDEAILLNLARIGFLSFSSVLEARDNKKKIVIFLIPMIKDHYSENRDLWEIYSLRDFGEDETISNKNKGNISLHTTFFYKSCVGEFLESSDLLLGFIGLIGEHGNAYSFRNTCFFKKDLVKNIYKLRSNINAAKYLYNISKQSLFSNISYSTTIFLENSLEEINKNKTNSLKNLYFHLRELYKDVKEKNSFIKNSQIYGFLDTFLKNFLEKS